MPKYDVYIELQNIEAENSEEALTKVAQAFANQPYEWVFGGGVTISNSMQVIEVDTNKDGLVSKLKTG